MYFHQFPCQFDSFLSYNTFHFHCLWIILISLLRITILAKWDVKSIVQLQLHGEYPKQLFSEKQREASAVSRKSCGLNYTNIFQLFLLYTQAAFSCFLFYFSWLLPLILLGICFYNLWLTAPKGMVNRKLGICRGIFGKIR